MEPYALILLRRFKAGESAEEIATAEGIPVERIEMRLAAAAAFEQRQKAKERVCSSQ